MRYVRKHVPMHGNVLLIMAKIQFVSITSTLLNVLIHRSKRYLQKLLCGQVVKSTKLDQQNEDRKCNMDLTLHLTLYPVAITPEITLNHTIMHLYN